MSRTVEITFRRHKIWVTVWLVTKVSILLKHFVSPTSTNNTVSASVINITLIGLKSTSAFQQKILKLDEKLQYRFLEETNHRSEPVFHLSIIDIAFLNFQKISNKNVIISNIQVQ